MNDKKFRDKKIRFILLDEIGKSRISEDISFDQIKESLLAEKATPLIISKNLQGNFYICQMNDFVVSALKYRPDNFDSVIGPLMNMA